jgi:hypothetical protein
MLFRRDWDAGLAPLSGQRDPRPYAHMTRPRDQRPPRLAGDKSVHAKIQQSGILRQDNFDWHDQERVAVEVAWVLQSLAIDLAMVGRAIQSVSSEH